ncbi:MAG TPA: polysaccharide pyruvyl transferase family protein [Candidatus Acidoferrales bacterium]|jgi:polysaccharide pyruvyl transferase WcaK-like protein|nr:polysaccharide pyruvyl transferase family protein [Candidatus Acidoferrales bacterium]
MMDFILEAWVSSSIERAKAAWMLGAGQRWRPGQKLKLLFAGYNGTRNMGSDVRVEEMLRQIRHILGAERVELSVMSQNFDFSRGYFEGTKQVHLPDIFPPFLAHEVPQHDGVVACEGSMFKSKFANALTTMMIGSLGIAAAQNKLSVGYGAEAGHMDPLVAKMCARYCRNSFVITRNEESRGVLRELGVPTELGTDTAWTFEPRPPEYGQSVLRKVGWDGRTPVLVVCPINPFEWPVKASVAKYAVRSLTGAYKDSHYRTVYFHNSGPAAEQAYRKYWNAIANALDAFRKRRNVFVILAATERLDARPANRIAEKLGGVPVLTSDEYNMYELVSVLRSCHMMASSRYHGIVTSMPGLVPSAGITMDERIRNLMRERGHQDLLMTVDDPELEGKLLAALEKLSSEGESIASGIAQTVVKNLKVMARMGVYLEEEVQRRYPEFETRRGEWSWEDYLPPMSPGLRDLLAVHN